MARENEADKDKSPVPKQSTSVETLSNGNNVEPKLSNATSEPLLTDDQQTDQTGMQRSMSESNVTDPKPPSPPPSSQDGEQGREPGRTPSLSESMRRVFMWTMTGFFDFNPAYLIQMRGILNVIHLILSLTTICLLGSVCKFSSYVGGNGYNDDDFICQPAETFLFVIAVSAFLTSTLYFCCCLLSKRTCALLFETSFEVSYFILTCILFLTASVTLLISALSLEPKRHTGIYAATQAAAVLSLVNSIAYGVSAVCFFVSHRYKETNEHVPMPT